MRDYSLQCVLLVNYGKMSEGLMMILFGYSYAQIGNGVDLVEGFQG